MKENVIIGAWLLVVTALALGGIAFEAFKFFALVKYVLS